MNPPPARRVGPILAKVFLAVGTTLVLLLACDLVLRRLQLVAPRSGKVTPKSAPYRLSEQLTVMQPGFVGRLQGPEFDVSIVANSDGFREREIGQPGDRRGYLLVGDSYFFGWGVEPRDRISEQLQRRIAGSPGAAEVFNYSLAGWGAKDYLEVLRIFTPDRVRPRHVFIGFFIGNDCLDDTGILAAGDRQAQRRKRLRQVLRTSPLVNLTRNALWTIPAFRDLFNETELRNDRLALYESGTSDRQLRLCQPSFEALTQIAALSRERGFQTLVVLIPDHLQVLSPELLEDLEPDRPQRLLAEHLDRIGLAYLDLLPHFRASPDPESLFFRYDKHWNAAGHDFVAGVLADWLVAHATEEVPATPVATTPQTGSAESARAKGPTTAGVLGGS